VLVSSLFAAVSPLCTNTHTHTLFLSLSPRKSSSCRRWIGTNKSQKMTDSSADIGAILGRLRALEKNFEDHQTIISKQKEHIEFQNKEITNLKSKAFGTVAAPILPFDQATKDSFNAKISAEIQKMTKVTGETIDDAISKTEERLNLHVDKEIYKLYSNEEYGIERVNDIVDACRL
jgi:ABC-type Fe3+-citrate transport system substrate-binding protein